MPCSVSTSRSSNRTCGFAASGSRTRDFSCVGVTALACNVAYGFPAVIGGVRNMPIPRLSPLLTLTLELRPLPSAGIARTQRYYGPLRLLRQPGLSLTGARLVTRPPSEVSRVAFDLLCRHAVANTPVGPRAGVLSLPYRRDGCHDSKPVTAAFPVIRAGRLPRLRCFEACSAFTRVTACLLAGPPSGPLHQRLRQCRRLHYRSDCYRLERPVAGRDLHPLKTNTFSRHTVN